MEKRYIVFGYENYYPSGGLSDIIGYAITIDEALKIANEEKLDWQNIDILDMHTQKEIEVVYNWTTHYERRIWKLKEVEE